MIVTDLSNSFNPCLKNITKKEKVKTRIKQKSNKLAKKEKDRFSILQKKMINVLYVKENLKN